MRISDWSSDVCSSDLTILRIDLQTGITFVRSDDFVNPGGAISLLRRVIKRKIDFDRHRRILQRQMDRLVFLVLGVGQENRGQPVKGDLAVGLGIVDRPDLILGGGGLWFGRYRKGG